jgi:RNA polymerase sigma-70 factor, ECF subfamily
MSSNETTAGCETVLTAMPGEPASLDEERDTAQSALHRYIECVLPNLRRYARSLTHDAVDADDLLQECLARALGKLQLWKAGTDLRAWLFSILHNEYVTQIRRAARQGTAVDWSEFESGLSAWPDRALGNTRPGTSAEIAARRTTHGGPDDQFDKRLLRGRVGVQSPRGTIRSRLSRGRKTLRALMSVAPLEPHVANRCLRDSLRLPEHHCVG